MAQDLLYSVRVDDAAGRSRRHTVNLPSTMSIANVTTFSDAYLVLLDAIMDGLVTEATVKLPVALVGGLKGAAIANGDVRIGALFSLINPSGKLKDVWVPNFTPSKFTGDLVNQAATGLAAYIAGLVSGAGGFSPTNGYGDDLTALDHAIKSIRK